MDAEKEVGKRALVADAASHRQICFSPEAVVAHLLGKIAWRDVEGPHDPALSCGRRMTRMHVSRVDKHEGALRRGFRPAPDGEFQCAGHNERKADSTMEVRFEGKAVVPCTREFRVR